MMIQTEMKAFEDQINLKLLGSIVSFVAQTASATVTQKNAIRRRCIFSSVPADSSAMQQEYGFLYLGELLERYEERFGMTPQDRRAIALALSYTKDIATDGMFVGSQRTDFIQSVEKTASGDIYLTGALYLLHEGQRDGLTYENQLKEWQFTQTEELLFAMSLFPNAEQALALFKPQLSHLLGQGRTLPVLGNTAIFQWMIAMLFPLKKQLKSKNMTVIRALLALPVSFVRESGKPYGYLLGSGYTPLEITYANVLAVESQCVPGGPGRASLTMEKIVVALFRKVMSNEEALPTSVYEQLTRLYSAYSRFEIKCYGVNRLSDVLNGGDRIREPETMAWFIGCESVYHPAVGGFNIMETKWDSLATKLEPSVYQTLFEQSLYESMGTTELQCRIDRYNELTQGNYLDYYSTDHAGGCFSLLVRAGIIDLWAAFQNSIGPDGTVTAPAMCRRIGEYVNGIQTIQAFRFFGQFLPQYGFDGVNQYLDPYRRGFKGSLWARNNNWTGEITLTISRDFLKDDANGLLTMLHWAEEYFFTHAPEQYMFFVLALLANKDAAVLLSQEDRRRLYELVICQTGIPGYTVEKLKQLYQTPEERQAEQSAREAAEVEQKRQNHLELIQCIEDDYADTQDGTVQSVQKFLDHHRYRKGQREIAACVVRRELEPLLQGKSYLLDRKEAACFLDICGWMLGLGMMEWAEIQSYIISHQPLPP